MMRTNLPILVFFILLMQGATVFGQETLHKNTISIHVGNESLGKVLEEIAKQSNFHFSFNSRKIDLDQTLSLQFDDASLDEVLKAIAHDLGLNFSIYKDQVILKKAKKTDSIPKHTISGYIRDQASGETLPGATVKIAGTQTGTISNAYGFYSLTLHEGENVLKYSFVGFNDQQRVIRLTDDLKLDLEMAFNSMELGEVTIEINDELENLEKSQMSRIRVNPKSLAGLPEFAGEVGLIKSLQSLPGIKTHSDGSAFFFVRGGNKDQNLILIDEAPVYNPAHLFGYYSVIIPDIAKEISIYKGDLPIEKGDRLSSIIDVQTKDGNFRNPEVNGVLNPLMYRFSAEGPIVKDKSSVFVSFRHSNFKWIYRQQSPNSNLYLLDVNAKINWKINNNNRLYYSFFYGADNFINNENTERGGIRWFNFTSTLRWNHVFNKRLFSNTTLYASRYDYTLLTGGTEWGSGISNVSLNIDFTFYPRPEETWKFGLSQTGHAINPGNLAGLEDNPFAPRIAKSQATKTVFYVNREHALSEQFSYKAGLRIPVWNNIGPTTLYQFDSLYRVTDTLIFQQGDKVQTFARLDPRLSVKYKLTGKTSLKASWGIYHQFLHLISNSISPFSSFEIWMPANSNLRPQEASQIALGMVSVFPQGHWELTQEAYYKKMKNQIDYEPHANLLLNPLIEGELRFGSAQSYGYELLLRRTKGRLTGWLSYTWSRSLKTIQGVNNNEQFPAYYDRPHDLSIFVSWHLSRKLNFSANWIYYTGSAITTPTGFYTYNGYTVPLYEQKNNDRLPGYHRLDVALLWQLNKPERKFKHSLSFAIYNLYNRHNAVSINFNKMRTRNGDYVVPANLYGTPHIFTTQKYLLGIMPSITYKFKL